MHSYKRSHFPGLESDTIPNENTYMQLNLSNEDMMKLKNSGDPTGFKPMTSATPVQCSNN